LDPVLQESQLFVFSYRHDAVSIYSVSGVGLSL
jgi:hypothetical protein